VPGVVGVEAAGEQLAAAERVVVGVDAGRFAAQDAHPVAGEHGRPEPLLVLSAVAALSGGAALLLGFAPVLLAPSGVGGLRAPGYGADGEGSASGHGDHALGSTVVAYGEGVRPCVRMLRRGCSWRRWLCCW
jgi:hypothetical protein